MFETKGKFKSVLTIYQNMFRPKYFLAYLSFIGGDLSLHVLHL